MNSRVFNKGFKGVDERKKHVERELDVLKLQDKISADVKGEIRGEDSPTGKYLENVANYILESKDIKSSRKIKDTFYLSEKYYRSHTAAGRYTVPDTEWIESIGGDNYYDRESYCKRLFRLGELTEDDLRSFILNWSNYTQEDLGWLEQSYMDLRDKIESVANEDDLKMLNLFDGKRSISEVATILGVKQPAITKRIKKISKNLRKMVIN